VSEPVNLRQRFGDRYRIGFDPAYDQRNVPRDKLDPWAMTIPCRSGLIYPFGGTALAVEVDGHPGLARRLATLPGVRLHQDGDCEKTFVFDAADFDAVAAIVRPRVRRRCHLSAERRAAFAAAGATALRRHRCQSNDTEQNLGT
jgi:hypothetical protein